MTKTEITMKWALWYWNKGYSIIPVNVTQKKALIKWEQYQKVRPSLDDVHQWWEKDFQNAGIAIVTGKLSNLLVVDLDTKEAIKEVDEYLPNSFITPTVISPRGGKHLYFTHQDGLINKAQYIPGCDVRTDGGIIIAPPSKGYKWQISIVKTVVNNIPSKLYSFLASTISNTTRYLSTNNCKTGANNDNHRQRLTTNDNQIPQGKRDDTLFHIAHCLTKGGMPHEEAVEILTSIGLYCCNPAFTKKECLIKVKSALERKKKKNRAWLDEIRDFILTTSGNVTTTSVQNRQRTTTREENKIVNQCLLRLEKEGLLKKTGRIAGEYRIISAKVKELKWRDAKLETYNITLPLGLHEAVRVIPGSIIMLAGVQNAGKTAFSMNIAYLNCSGTPVHYFSSEISDSEFKERLLRMGDKEELDNVHLFADFEPQDLIDIIHPDELNIIDYLEPPMGDYTQIAPIVTDIQRTLQKGIAIICLQKKSDDKHPAGGQYLRNKPHLYCRLDKVEYPVYKITIEKCKAMNHGYRNPTGKSCEYKIDHDGITIIPYGTFGFERWDGGFTYGEELEKD